jgi:hypothetical protein
MRTLGPLVLVPLVLLLASDMAQAQTRQFNPNCGLLGSFAQYRAHNQHCKTTEQVRKTNIVPNTVRGEKCGPTLRGGLVGGIVGSTTTGINAGAGKIGGVL